MTTKKTKEEEDNSLGSISGILLCLLGLQVHCPEVINKQGLNNKFVEISFYQNFLAGEVMSGCQQSKTIP